MGGPGGRGARARPDGRRPGPRNDDSGREAQELPGHLEAAHRRDAAGAAPHPVRDPFSRSSARPGPSSGPRSWATPSTSSWTGCVGKQLGQYLPPGTTHDQAVVILRQTQPQIADLFASTTAVPGVGVDFGALGFVLSAWRACTSRPPSSLALLVHHGRRVPADRLPAPPRRRHQARPPAAQVLRHAPARRHPEPRHQRHRQHRQHAAAEPEPDHHVASPRSSACWR